MKPMLFNTEMVKAIMEGRKTVTRRVLKEPFEIHSNGFITKPKGNERLCPYVPPFQIDDILYVRETFAQVAKHIFWYRADGAEYTKSILWKPSIHMPKEAARIFLKIKDVRVERLQDITEEQAKAEGIREYTKDGKLWKYAVTDDWWIEYHRKNRKYFSGSWWQDMPRTAKEAFRYLWNSTLGRKDTPEYYGNCWTGNPYVWVIEFERITKEQAYELESKKA